MASVAGRLDARLPAAPTGVAGIWIAGALLALSNFMVVLDIAIANVSVPHIAGSLAISPDEGTWVITSYSVAEAICVPLTGWLAARFGTVRVYLLAMTGFGIFSVLCGLSVSLTMLVACRVGQGLCGGPIMPLTQTLLLRTFPPEKRGQGMGLWAMTTVVAPIAGPLLGGSISDTWSWHWIFFINIPIALICVGGNFIMLRGKETKTVRQKVDVVGLVLLAVWVGALQIMLDLGRDRDWFGSSLIVGLAVVAAIGFCAFAIWELTEEQPIVNLRVFRHRGFSAAVVVLAVTFGIYFAAVVVTPQWLQGALGYTATWAGMVTAWSGLFAIVMSQVVGRVVTRVDPRILVFCGVMWMGFTMVLRSHWTSSVDYWSLVIPHLLIGIGMPMFFVPITLLSLSAVQPEETASAAGMSSFVRTFAGAVATSIATTVWGNNIERDHSELAGLLNNSSSAMAQLQAQGFAAPQLRAMVDGLVTSEASVLALTQLFQDAAVLLVFSACLIWLVPRPRRAADTSAAH